MSLAAKTLTGEDIRAGQKPQVGDVVILKDFVNCYPRSAIKAESVKGKWWLRSYRTESGSAGEMLCVEERDMDDPASCIAPELKYHLNLEGTYDIWVATYRPIFGGGIDIKLTRDETYAPIDPWEEEITQWPPRDDQIGRIVELFWKTADLTDQNIYLRQPHGTYGSLWWGLCNAHLAYIKLVRRSPEDVEREAAAKAKLEHKGVVIDRDGFSYVWMWGEKNTDCILQQVENFQYGNVEALNWCIGGSLGMNFPHPMTSGRVPFPGGGRLGDQRAREIFGDFYDRGIDVLRILTDRCHEIGIKIYASHRANVHYYASNIWNEHPDWRLKSGGGLDYANPEARGFYRDMLLWIAENYDIDGLTIDWTRHRRHFNPGQENQFYHINTYLRELREGLDRIGQQKGKHLVLNCSFTCGTWYDGWTPQQQGMDVATWVEEGFVDCIMPDGRDTMKYIEMCVGKDTKCYGRYTTCADFAGGKLMANVHDPTPSEDKADRPALNQYGPLDLMEGILNWYDAGADGVLLFNFSDAWVPLRNLPYPEIIRQELASGQPFGQREGEKVEWTE